MYTWLPALILLGACTAAGPRVPGPLRSVGAVPPPVAHPIVDSEPDSWDGAESDTSERPPNAGLRVTRRAPDPYGESIADAALHYLDRKPKGFRDDCSGFVMACLDRAGTPLSGNTASLWTLASDLGATHRRKVPRVGDLAFFDNTYDRNGNGRWDDELSHVAVVTAIDPDGTVHMAHAGTSKGRTTLIMNLRDPSSRTDDNGKELNDWLRRKRDRDPKSFRYLSGELWRGFAQLDPDALATTD